MPKVKSKEIPIHLFSSAELDGMCRQFLCSSYNEVFNATYNGEAVAIKRFQFRESTDLDDIENKKETLARFRREIRFFKAVDNKAINIVRFFGHGSYKFNDLTFNCVVMQFCAGRDLHRYIYRNDCPEWKTRLAMMSGLAKAVTYIHDHDYVHGDLKSPNVLLTHKLNIRLADFETTAQADEISSSLCTYEWRAPELFNENVPGTFASDVCSAGVIFWEIAGWHQMEGGKKEDELKLIAHQEPRLKLRKNCLPEIASIINACWRVDPELRPEIKKVKKDLKAIELPILKP